MKKILSIIIILLWTSSGATEGAQLEELLGLRKNLQEESKALRAMLVDTKDVLYVNTLCDSLAMSIMQIDAYFTMIGIHESIPLKYRRKDGPEYMMKWLTAVKNTHDLNIKTLGEMAGPSDPRTGEHISKIKTLYESLCLIVDGEMDKLTVLKHGYES